MYKVCFLTVLLFVAYAAKAQYVSLSDAEFDKLNGLISSDADVKASVMKYRQIADGAMNENASPIDTIRTEGLLKGDPRKNATNTALKDFSKMYALALIYRTEGDKELLKDAVSYLTAWAKVNVSRGDPIDDTNLGQVIEAYDMVKGNMKPADNELVKKWFTQVANAEIKTFNPKRETSRNNWNSHRLKIIGQIAWAINNKEYQQFVVEQLKVQIAQNLYADGSGMDFKLRDALHYHVYDLEPLLQLAIVLKRATGVDYFNYVSASQSSIKQSVDWLVPYVTGEKTHGEFVNSTVKFDQLRAKNNEPDYQPGVLFDPKNGIKTLALASYFDSKYVPIIIKTDGANSATLNWNLVLNKVML